MYGARRSCARQISTNMSATAAPACVGAGGGASGPRTTVITIVSDAFTWTPGDAWWDVGVPQVSARAEVNAAAADQQAGRRKQRVGV